MNIPDYGAIGYHKKGRGWFVDIYIWRRGPWRLQWSLYRHRFSGSIELSAPNTFFSRAIVDTLWGMQQR